MSTTSILPRLDKLLSRYHFLIAVFIVIIIIFLEGMFLYQNFFHTLRETKTLMELKEQAVLEPLKFNSFENAMRTLELKKTKASLRAKTIRNPFTPLDHERSGLQAGDERRESLN